MTMIRSRTRRLLLMAVLAAPAALASLVPPPADKPVPAAIERAKGKAQLLRDGKPYFIRGAGGQAHLDQLAEVGGNSIRTWGVGNETSALLDAAHKHGITVTLGVWLTSVNDMDYGDEAALKKQAAAVVRAVKKHKDHPALLMWAIGNEMEGEGNDRRVYEQLERLAVQVKALDPVHPTMTVIAELGGGKKVRDLDSLAPSIDIIGINSYGAAHSVPGRYRNAGGTRPYVLTEFGPAGHWECPKTPYGLPLEKSSTEKAQSYRKAYKGAVDGQPLCLGSYAFLWGHKQETTATWYGMLLPDGSRLGAVDAMQEFWTGQKPRNRCPEISKIDGADLREIRPGDRIKVSVLAADPDGNRLTVQWVLRPASAGTGRFGQREDAMADLTDAVRSTLRLEATIELPKDPGTYRLFAYVRDGKGGAAVHNVPIRTTP